MFYLVYLDIEDGKTSIRVSYRVKNFLSKDLKESSSGSTKLPKLGETILKQSKYTKKLIIITKA